MSKMEHKWQYKKIIQSIFLLLLLIAVVKTESNCAKLNDNKEEPRLNYEEIDSKISWQKNFVIDYLDERQLYAKDIILKSDQEGNLHLVYKATVTPTTATVTPIIKTTSWEEIHYQLYNITEKQWQEKTIIAGEQSEESGKMDLQMVIDNQSRIHVAWYEDYFNETNSPKYIFYRYFENNNWSEKILVEIVDDTLTYMDLQFAVAGNKALFFWTVLKTDYTELFYQMLKKSYSVETEELGEKMVLENITLSSHIIDVAVDSDGKIIVAWTDYNEELEAEKLFYVYEKEEDLHQVIPKILCHFDNSEESKVNMVFDANNNLHLAWQRTLGGTNNYIVYARKEQEVMTITVTLEKALLYDEVKIAIDEQNTANILWKNLVEGLKYKRVTTENEVTKTEVLLANQTVQRLAITTTNGGNIIHVMYTLSELLSSEIFLIRGMTQRTLDKYGAIIIGVP
ncbi:MAG: hypothetical protein FK734_12565, partial [Asgard group archaeon]|nr:hypothetical protein [Asgard group archaeon]